MKKLAILFSLTLCVALAGCSQPTASQGSEPAQEPSDTVSTPSAEEPKEQTATLYIGTKAEGFTEYPMPYEGELTPEMLIQGIADLTDWNLTLAEDVTRDTDGMSVCLSNESSLFIGPPETQKEEFHMYDPEQLAETILDSIQETLQKGFVPESGDPDSLNIWYYTEGMQPLELPGSGLSWPVDQPYQWTGAQSE